MHNGQQCETEPPIVRELKLAGVQIIAFQVRAASQQLVHETETSWGGSHGVEFEPEPTEPRYEQIPALYIYEAPQILLLLERWVGDDPTFAAWAAKTFSPGTLGTMYALHEGDWNKYMREMWHESTKGNRR